MRTVQCSNLKELFIAILDCPAVGRYDPYAVIGQVAVKERWTTKDGNVFVDYAPNREKPYSLHML